MFFSEWNSKRIHVEIVVTSVHLLYWAAKSNFPNKRWTKKSNLYCQTYSWTIFIPLLRIRASGKVFGQVKRIDWGSWIKLLAIHISNYWLCLNIDYVVWSVLQVINKILLMVAKIYCFINGFSLILELCFKFRYLYNFCIWTSSVFHWLNRLMAIANCYPLSGCLNYHAQSTVV